MKETESVSRRKFIGTSAIAGAAASFPYVAKGEALQSDTIRVAAIGLGAVELVQLLKFLMHQRT